MADAIVERGTTLRFFCHRCLVEFQDVLQDYTCPFCDGGFIEQLEDTDNIPLSGDYSDADMSNIEDMDMSNLDSDEGSRGTLPMPMSDLAFLMSGGRIRSSSSTANGTPTTTTTGTSNSPRRPTLVEELIYMIGGGRPPAGAMTAAAPFVLVGTPGDYVFGGEGLDAVVTQLLGQLEHSGPPPLPRERLAALPTEHVTEEQANANTACSVCWENFQLGETISRLECEHVFHQGCITPWLQLHATCPVCRRSLLPPDADPPAAAASGAAAAAPAPAAANSTSGDSDGVTVNVSVNPTSATSTTTVTTTTVTAPSTDSLADAHIRMRAPRVVIRRAAGRHPGVFRRFHAQWDSINDTSSSSSPGSSITAGGVWLPQNRSSSSTGSNSSSSINNDRDRQYNMDMDFD